VEALFVIGITAEKKTKANTATGEANNLALKPDPSIRVFCKSGHAGVDGQGWMLAGTYQNSATQLALLNTRTWKSLPNTKDNTWEKIASPYPTSAK
jgi:hypothetical protein